MATDAPVDFAVGLAKALLTAIVFIGVLWNVGGDIVVDGDGWTVTFPGYLVVGAVVYALGTTVGMLVTGRRLVQVIEDKNHAEAGFRRAASRLREGALLQSDAQRRGALRAAVGPVIARWRDLCGQLMRTTVISQGNSLVAPVVALFLCAPKYLAGTMSLGEVTQAAAAFFAVQAAFNWLVDNYPRLADWTSAVNRVAALLVSLDQLDRFNNHQRRRTRPHPAPCCLVRGGLKTRKRPGIRGASRTHYTQLVRISGGDLGRFDLQQLAGARDGDRPRFHRLRNLAHEIDVQESVLHDRALDLDMLGELEAALEAPRGNALIQQGAGLLRLVGLLLATDRQNVLFRLDREISFSEAGDREGDTIGILVAPLDIVGRIARHGAFHAVEHGEHPVEADG